MRPPIVRYHRVGVPRRRCDVLPRLGPAAANQEHRETGDRGTEDETDDHAEVDGNADKENDR